MIRIRHGQPTTSAFRKRPIIQSPQTTEKDCYAKRLYRNGRKTPHNLTSLNNRLPIGIPLPDASSNHPPINCPCAISPGDYLALSFPELQNTHLTARDQQGVNRHLPDHVIPDQTSLDRFLLTTRLQKRTDLPEKPFLEKKVKS